MSTPHDPYGQPQYPGQPAYGQAPVGPNGEKLSDPDNTLGIVGLVLVFVCGGIVGLIVSWIALNKSKKRGYKNTPALVGVILGAIGTVLLILYIIFGVILMASSSSTSYLLV